jgi:ribosomal protein S21
MGRRNRPINFEISSKDVPNPEKMIRRFMKKVSKLKILEEYVEKTSFYKKPSQIRNEKKRRIKREIQKQRTKNKNT